MAEFYPFMTRIPHSGDGANSANTWIVTAQAYGKSANQNSPYLIANEWIAGAIGQFLRLPIPPFALLRSTSVKTVMFCSQSFEGDATPDDTDPVALQARHARLSAGIVVFDILIANRDRGWWNIKVDNAANPKVIRLFDHEKSLFYVQPKQGIDAIRSRVSRLGITQSGASKHDTHCLLKLLKIVDDLSFWIRRIETIPDWFIDDVADEVLRIAITKAERDAVRQFLKERRDNLAQLIYQHRNRFTGINQWPLVL